VTSRGATISTAGTTISQRIVRLSSKTPREGGHPGPAVIVPQAAIDAPRFPGGPREGIMIVCGEPDCGTNQSQCVCVAA
jgi:hypothetical protein